MTLELLRTLTPLITFSLMLGLGVIGWFIRRLIGDMEAHFSGLRREFRERLDKVERGLDRLEAARLADYQHLYERFVPKEWYLQTRGRTERTLARLPRRRHGRRRVRRTRLRHAG